MAEVEVRRLRSTEWRELRDLRLQALRNSPLAFGSTYEREAAYTEERWQEWAASSAAGEKQVAIVALAGDSWVAMAGGYLPTPDDPGAPSLAWLVAVYVHPTWRGRGLGRAVSEGVISWAREREAAEVRLHVADWNDAARRVYEELGFTPTGDSMTLPHDPTVSEVEMSLRL